MSIFYNKHSSFNSKLTFFSVNVSEQSNFLDYHKKNISLINEYLDDILKIQFIVKKDWDKQHNITQSWSYWTLNNKELTLYCNDKWYKNFYSSNSLLNNKRTNKYFKNENISKIKTSAECILYDLLINNSNILKSEIKLSEISVKTGTSFGTLMNTQHIDPLSGTIIVGYCTSTGKVHKNSIEKTNNEYYKYKLSHWKNHINIYAHTMYVASHIFWFGCMHSYRTLRKTYANRIFGAFFYTKFTLNYPIIFSFKTNKKLFENKTTMKQAIVMFREMKKVDKFDNIIKYANIICQESILNKYINQYKIDINCNIKKIEIQKKIKNIKINRINSQLKKKIKFKKFTQQIKREGIIRYNRVKKVKKYII